ncbi:FxLYD domain-containing protein [Sandaracinobacteroides hominis]|uniref:FxLYD domain-containing protein n=1 Tax=Sandaracinobacteroides hominis TaxID=2780086 RepID=UPI0018F6743A|nr:FxLYD domain-containing protein [Sandaracinobacteroides hominis]
MQLTCPGCGARYRIDATSWPTEPGPDGEAVHRPRRARCKVCRTIWEALPEEEVLELDDPMPPDEPPRLADAAWASVAGWPDPRPLPAPPAPKPDFSPPLDRPPPVFSAPGFTPPKDPSAPIYAAPARPSIHFEAPPVPLPTPPERRAIRPRLLGPGAYQDEEADELPPSEADEELPASEWTGEEWPDEDEKPRRRIWPWLLALLLALAVTWAALVAAGRVQPEDYGLPPYDPSVIGLDQVQLPAIALPRTPPPPLTIEADAGKRRLSDNRQIWEVKGVIRNPTRERLPVPPVEILLLDAQGRTVGRWMVRPEIETLAPGGTADFETSAIDPPSSAARMRLQLKPGELGRL